MPLVRLSHTAGKTAAEANALSQGVHRALVETFNVPADDYFHVVTAHAPSDGLLATASFLGISHTPDMVIVQITCSEGRTLEQKKALYAGIADNLARDANIRREDVMINLVETKRENWSFGNGLAQYT